MKRIFAVIATMVAFVAISKADDRPVTYEQLPAAAKTFITKNFANDKVSFATKDDDLIRPDYNVMLVSGVRLDFDSNGNITKIESRSGVAENLIPTQIVTTVKQMYPDVLFYEFEINRKTYEVKISNGLDIEFNKLFQIIEIDD